MSFKLRDEHWEVLVSFLEKNVCLATGQFSGPNGRQTSKELWEEVSVHLNSLGYGTRSSNKWKKSWIDIKYLMKKKGANLRKEQKGTGGGPVNVKPFNRFENRILNILGPSFINGVGEPEIGCSNVNIKRTIPFWTSNKPQVKTENIDDHSYSIQPPKKKQKYNTEEYYLETIEILKSIQNTIETGLNNIAKEIRELKNQ